MKYLIVFVSTILIFGCHEAKPVYTNIVGTAKDTASMAGVNSVIVILRDLEPTDRVNWRIRRDTTEDGDSGPGWFEFDDVCYGDENYMTYVIIGVDTSDNPQYKTRQYEVTVKGPLDTVPTVWLVKK